MIGLKKDEEELEKLLAEQKGEKKGKKLKSKREA